ncbi:putative transcription initiation factor tfiid subunit 12 [Golovinomyces cichoracearum]|uniref:Putative transcription initiation factor tfiid subunit 12 n=1 Tax=Golovinomyces cichoracearum TaxID=62708 RepID=A0A420IFR9_9PEZI|nr:putative transcription initiation factor tfiid subunit 12 [Golovinomyces cichoracearum]
MAAVAAKTSIPRQQQQQQQQQQRKVPLFRPEQMRLLPDQFTSEERTKWETGLRTLWTQIEKNTPDTATHMDAKRKLFDFSRTLQSKIQSAQVQKAAHSPSLVQQQAGDSSNLNGQARQQQHTKIPPKIMEHVTNFPFQLPPGVQAGSEAAQKWLLTAKNGYLKALLTMEHSSIRLSAAEAALKNNNVEGKQLTPEEEKEWTEKKDLAQKQSADAKTYVEQFHQQQNQYKAANLGGQQCQTGQPIGANSNMNQAAIQATRSQIETQEPNPVTQTINAAIEAARNQQIAGRRTPQSNQVSQVPGHSSTTRVGSQTVKMEGNIPPSINTSTSQIQGQQRSIQTSPQPTTLPRSAGIAPPAGAPQQPQALSHSDALGLAARTYSSNNHSTPSIMGHSHPTSIEKPRPDNSMSNKLPIPKHLPDHVTALPQPVPMPQVRPSITGGPSNITGGILGQPVMTKMPGFNMEGDGDRVLSKKKLDELVRQITGGGQGGSDGVDGVRSLAPDVEENILQVADNFVDQVLQAACKNAKERGSRTLEIRDIQLTLERGYNIRIPGYASDEIRTVRKIQPAPGWIAKMSAVQAAKVTGGKNSD